MCMRAAERLFLRTPKHRYNCAAAVVQNFSIHEFIYTCTNKTSFACSPLVSHRHVLLFTHFAAAERERDKKSSGIQNETLSSSESSASAIPTLSQSAHFSTYVNTS